MMTRVPFGICGTGFWAQFQLSAWKELGIADCVAICDPNLDKARSFADRFGIARIYNSVESMLSSESLRFIDVISSPSSHESIVCTAAEHHIPVICQKPMSEQWDACVRMVDACRRTSTWFAIHENWRWQCTLRRVKQLIHEHRIGDVFRCRIDFITAFDVFENQPTLRDCEQFIIADLACHVLDYARSLFGEATSIYCRTQRVAQDIRGEDVATMSMVMNRGRTIVDVHVAYARSPNKNDCFPQTLLFAEGSEGSLHLEPNYQLSITDRHGTQTEFIPPIMYPWLDPRYAIVHSSMVACNQHLLACLLNQTQSETDGEDNLRTMDLVFKAYQSAANHSVIQVTPTLSFT